MSKETLDFCVRPAQGAPLHFREANSKAGLAAARKRLRAIPGFKEAACLVCMEHTGIYSFLPACGLQDMGLGVWVEPAQRIKNGTGEIVRGKSDKIDAARIADYAQRFRDRCVHWHRPSESLMCLKAVMAERERLRKAIHLLKVPAAELKAVLGKAAPAQSTRLKRILDAMDAEVKALDRKARDIIKADPELLRLHRLITSVKGIGATTAAALLVATNGFSRMTDARKLACHAGCAPFPNSSGTSLRGRDKVSHKADKGLKALLQNCATSAVKAPGEIREYHRRKLAEGKPKMLVMNAVRNKLIRRVCACVREDRPCAPQPRPR